MEKRPRECFYDAYVHHISHTIHSLKTALEAEELLGMEVPRLISELENYESLKALEYAKKEAKKITPRLLTRGVVDIIFEAVSKAGDTPLPYKPFPKIPFWIEFDEFAVITENKHENSLVYKGILINEDYYDQELLLVQFLTPDFQTKNMYIRKDEGQWIYIQTGACGGKGRCPKANSTEEGIEYGVQVEEYQDLANLGCNCARAGYYWSQVIRACSLVLGQPRPFVYKEIDNTIPIPHKVPKTKKQRAENTQVEIHNRRSAPRYVEVSLSEPMIFKPRPAGSSAPGHAGTTTPIDYKGEKITVESFIKLLVPAEGKPWKEIQIVPVESYKRRGHNSVNRTRKIVKE